jgi:hypothetical protein
LPAPKTPPAAALASRSTSGPPARPRRSSPPRAKDAACDTVALVSERNALKTLAGVRMAIGLGAWATPRLAGKLFGLDAQANPQSPYLARLFGVRDLALAWGALGAQGSARRQWLLAGLACDTADAVAGVVGGRAGYLPKLTSVLVSGTAVSAAVLGVAALRDS